ncbi:dual specificity mitogen-activated protein kinase kinase 5-like [Acropora muricata]|uniref:dual specificity mitogen-activated protein kinase kinase 5-like n=1 Tax=Acropora millepora TaxID=45264 RepID=UPI001CF4D9B2|nr:dual specificity mitogen-activated protein kinase kinase 5-like [Acropora millepora]
MSLSPSLVIRIVPDEGEAVDWTVHQNIVFRDVLEAISQVMPNTTATAFEYDDEEGDRITVRGDEELQAMISGYLWMTSERLRKDLTQEPLIVYPKACRTSRRRNFCGLTVNTKASPVNNTVPVVKSQPKLGLHKTEHGDIRNLLANGQVSHTDIQYLDILGHGNGGTVYRALHSRTNRIIAVKVIPLDVTPAVQKQIISELEILFQCSSLFIIEFYGAFFVENRISICTEFMDGGSLDAYGSIPEPVLGRIAVSVVKGLRYLWELKIMHRDVKPSNILVSTRGQVKLCDFGVSRQLVNSIATTYVGTHAYMAPERILGDEYSIRSELWSLGVSLLEMALGRFPYPTDSRGGAETFLPIALLQCIVHENPPCLPGDKFSPGFVNFVSQCMQKSPLSRMTPEAVLTHPFIASNDDGNVDMISMWVCRQLEERRSRVHSMDSPSSE